MPIIQMPSIGMVALVCALVFAAGFIDSIAGGGGLISVPAYMLTGIPMHWCSGSNKFSGFPGTAIAAYRFYKSGNVDMPNACFSAVFAVLGAFIGARAALMMDAVLLKKVFLAALPFVVLFVLFFGKGRVREKKLAGNALRAACAAIGFVCGLYDGLIGPGTGTVLIFAYTTFVGYSYLTASGNAKIVNLASNVTSLITYLLAGRVLFYIAVPAAVCSLLGGYLGSGLAIKKGDKVVKAILIVMLIAVFAKLVSDVF